MDFETEAGNDRIGHTVTDLTSDNPNEQVPDDAPEPTYEELLARITHEKQLRFLDKFPASGYLNRTAEAIGLSFQAVYYWMTTDRVFLEAFEALKKQTTVDIIERHEQNIEEVCFDKDTPAQSRIFGSLVRLRAEAPDKYREKANAVPFTGTIKVELSVPRPSGSGLEVKTEPPKQLPGRVEKP